MANKNITQTIAFKITGETSNLLQSIEKIEPIISFAKIIVPSIDSSFLWR